MKIVNLQEILQAKAGHFEPEEIFHILSAMREACKQTVKLCAENFKESNDLVLIDCDENNTKSILDTLDQVLIHVVLFADGFDDAILGLNDDNELRVVYSKKKMIEILAKEYENNPDVDDPEHDPYTEAVDFLYHNTFTAYMGKGTPLYNDDDIEEEEIEDSMEINIYPYLIMNKDEISVYVDKLNYE